VNANLAAVLYLVSGVLFILALRGLSSPVTSRRGNQLGMVGMVLAVGVTVLTLWGEGALDMATLGLIVGGVAIGGGVGAVIARRVAMTAMPQLVAAFHSLVGLAACLVAVAAVYTPAAYGIADALGHVKLESLIELSVGVAIGAVTFTGSLIAFAKLNGNMSGAPIMLPARHLLNIAIAVAVVVLIVVLVVSGGDAKWAFWGVFALALLAGITLIIPIGGADMPVVVSMLNSYSGWAAAALGFTLGNTTLIITGALVGSSGAILSYIMCKGMNRSFISVILGGFGGDAAVAGPGGAKETRPVKQGSADDAAFIMKNASKVIIVPGRGPGPARLARNGRHPEKGRRRGKVRHPPRRRPHARTYERAARRGQCALRRGVRARRYQFGVLHRRRRLRHRRQRRDQPRRQDRSHVADLRHADPGGRKGAHGAVHKAQHGRGLRRRGKRTVLPRQHHDAVRRRQEDGRGDHQGAIKSEFNQAICRR
jgi:NAD/NADP transhydrogenase beta subunit